MCLSEAIVTSLNLTRLPKLWLWRTKIWLLLICDLQRQYLIDERPEQIVCRLNSIWRHHQLCGVNNVRVSQRVYNWQYLYSSHDRLLFIFQKELFQVTCGAIITQYNMPWYFTQYRNHSAEQKADIEFTKGTPCRAYADEIWGVYCEDLGEKWPRYNGIALYMWHFRVDELYQM